MKSRSTAMKKTKAKGRKSFGPKAVAAKPFYLIQHELDIVDEPRLLFLGWHASRKEAMAWVEEDAFRCCRDRLDDVNDGGVNSLASMAEYHTEIAYGVYHGTEITDWIRFTYEDGQLDMVCRDLTVVQPAPIPEITVTRIKFFQRHRKSA